LAVAPNEKSQLAGPARPLGSPDIPQFHLPGPSGKGVYAPRLYGAATIHFGDRRRRVDERRHVAFTVPLDGNARTIDWDAAQPVEVRPGQLSAAAPGKGDYLPLPPGAMEPKTFTRWARTFDRWLARTQRLEVPPRPEQPDDPPVLGPKRGGVSVELVAIVWELTK
jgi:hypothetical protein